MARNGFRTDTGMGHSFTNEAIANILTNAHLNASEVDGLVYVCMDCESTCSAATRFDADMIIAEFEMVCCNASTTLHPNW